jgi:heptosyltransferase I
MQAPTSIAFLRLSAIGDVCNAVSVVQAIQQQFPRAKITWIIGRVEAQLIHDLPNIEFIIFDKKQGLKAYLHLAHQMKGRHFDYLLHMQVALRANIAAYFIPATHKIGFDPARAKELHHLFINDCIAAQQHEHVLEGFQGFAKKLGVNITQAQWQIPIPDAAQAFADNELNLPQRYFVICPCASKAERNWLAARYAALADYAAEKNYAVVLCGGNSALEQTMGSDIEDLAKTPIKNLIGKTNLKSLFAALKKASIVLAPDTGPLHMAVSVGTPVIGLYAHSNPNRTGPYLFREYCVSYYEQACLAQFGKPVSELKWGKRAKGEDLMTHISIDDVKKQFDKIDIELKKETI